MVLSTGQAADADPRLLPVQADRATKMLRTTVVSSPFWVGILAYMTSDLTPFFGRVPGLDSLLLVAVVLVAVGATQLVLRRYYRERDAGTISADEARRWLDGFFLLSAGLSAVWGWGMWLLWDGDSDVNHVFVTFACLAIVARFVVHRANHVRFFLASFLPLTAMLVVRLVIDFGPMELMLAALVPLYALQVIMDSGNISRRWDEEAMTRLSIQDMSVALKDARDEALAKRAEAEAASTSKTAFLASMSHELRTPLNAILGFSDIIAHEFLGPVGSPRYREYANDIHVSGKHLLSLINDILDVAKIEAGRMELTLSLLKTRDCLDDALKFVIARAAERRQVLTIEIDEAAEFVYADERAIRQIVINLVSNAVKYTQDGGRIEVRAKPGRDHDFELCVADNGPGIPAAALANLFKPYTRADNHYRNDGAGTGLGLMLVKRLAELHGGRAWLDSAEGKGTRAFVVLPTRAGEEKKRLRA